MVEELVSEILHPALRRMIAEFQTERTEQRNAVYRKHHKTLIATAGPCPLAFRHALSAVDEVLRNDFSPKDEPLPASTSEFLRSIGRELEIEEQGEGRRHPAGRTP